MQDKDPALPHNLIPSPCRFYPSPTSSRAADENLSSFSPVQWVLFHSALSRFASFLESYWYPELRNAGNLGGKSTSILLPFDRQATIALSKEARQSRVEGKYFSPDPCDSTTLEFKARLYVACIRKQAISALASNR